MGKVEFVLDYNVMQRDALDVSIGCWLVLD